MISVLQIAVLFSVGTSLAAAQHNLRIEYVGGNVQDLPVKTFGYLQLRDDDLATFHTALGSVRLPYERIECSLQPRQSGLKGTPRTIRLEVQNEDGTKLAMLFRLSSQAAESIMLRLKERKSTAQSRKAKLTSSRLESSLR